MNCDEPMIAREDAVRLSTLQCIAILNWAIRLCGSGMTPSMIRKQLHNKIVELEGKGERA